MKFLTKMNRALSLILVFVLIVGLLPVNVFATETGDDVSAITTEETTTPTDETTAPSEETTAPSEETTAPSEETTAPSEETTAATEETVAPTEETLPQLPDLVFGSVSEDAMVSEIQTVDEVNDASDIDYLFVASDRHGDEDVIGKLIAKMEAIIGGNELDYLALAGDMIGSGSTHTEYNSSTVMDEIQTATSSLNYGNVNLVAGIHDVFCNDDAGILIPYGSNGAYVYEGEKYCVYALNEFLISEDPSYPDEGTPYNTVPSYETFTDKAEQFISKQAQEFIDWAEYEIDKSKVIIVVSHYPLHYLREDNDGAYIWHQALNTVATGSPSGDDTVERNVLFFHGHNHTIDKTELVYNVGETMTIQNVETTTSEPIYYTYATAGYLTEDADRGNGQATLVAIDDTKITLTKYSSTADSAAVTTVTRVCADPSHEHTYETYVRNVTCERDGYTKYTCTTCGYSYKTDEITAPGHSFEDVYTAPTCVKMGSTVHTCTTCGYKYEDIEYALGHNYEMTYTAPTCTKYGYSTFECTVCDYSYVGAYEAATGHNITEEVVAPTCTEDGCTKYICTTCGDVSTTPIAKLGHSYESEVIDGSMVYNCTVCGYSYSEELTDQYTYESVSVFEAGSKYVVTMYSGGKYYAMSHQDNALSAVEVTVSGTEITSAVTSDLLWDYTGSKLCYEDDGTVYYLYGYAKAWNSYSLELSTTKSSSVVMSGSRVKIGSYYLRYSGGTITMNRSASTAYVYVQK